MKNDWLKESLIAHRGFYDNKKNIPENSMIAFQKALNKQYAIEFDVRLTKDKKIVVFHDHSLKRLCGENIIVESTNYDELLSHKLLNSKEKILLLKSVLDYIKGQVPVLIELKTFHNARIISKELDNVLSTYDGKFAIQSFDYRVLLWYKNHNKSVLRGQIAQKFTHKKCKKTFSYITGNMITNIFTKPNFINYRLEDMPLKSLNKYYNKGIPILAFTAKSQEELNFVRSTYDNAVFEGFTPIISN